MILITSPHPYFTKMAKTICKERNIKVHIVESTLDYAVEVIQNKLLQDLEEEIEVIVSRGGTADTLKRHFKMPIVTADISGFNTIKAFWEAKQICGSFGYLGYKGDDKLYNLPFIEKLLGANIKFYEYSNTAELHVRLHQARADHLDLIVVGSHLAEEYAKELDMNVVLVYSDEIAINEALVRAEEIISALAYEKNMNHKLKTVMNLSQEGMMIVDSNGTISYVNTSAESILHIGTNRLTGGCINESGFQAIFEESVNNQMPVVGKIQDVNSHQLIVNCLPLVLNQKKSGVVINFSNIKNIQQIEQQIRQELSKQGLIAKHTFDDIIGRSSSLMESVKAAKQFGLSNHTVIISGETGTGKERFANGIHNVSMRKDNPFVAVNCGAFPENLLESELFGYVDGAFTGAKKGGKKGLLELAHGGTLFLDEIDKMSLDSQAKILRVLQERQIRPVGSNKMIPVDVRIIAATNKNLIQLTKTNEFLLDLYFRLNVLNIKIPPLRERKEDILILVNSFCQNYSPSVSMDIFTQDIREKLIDYDWPGNVRELENLTYRYITLRSSHISGKNIYRYFPEFEETSQKTTADSQAVDGILLSPGLYKDMEQQLFQQMLERFEGNKSVLANYMGVSRNTIARILKVTNI